MWIESISKIHWNEWQNNVVFLQGESCAHQIVNEPVHCSEWYPSDQARSIKHPRAPVTSREKLLYQINTSSVGRVMFTSHISWVSMKSSFEHDLSCICTTTKGFLLCKMKKLDWEVSLPPLGLGKDQMLMQRDRSSIWGLSFQMDWPGGAGT